MTEEEIEKEAREIDTLLQRYLPDEYYEDIRKNLVPLVHKFIIAGRTKSEEEISDLEMGQDQQAVDMVKMIDIIDRAYWHMRYNPPDKTKMSYNEWESCLEEMKIYRKTNALKK